MPRPPATAIASEPISGSYETPYPLVEAVRRFFPAGGVTPRSLRTEHANGNLALTIIAGRYFVTESALAAMLRRRTHTCPAAAKPRASTSDGAEAAPTNGSSSTEHARSARAAAEQSVTELKRSTSTHTSPPNIRELYI